MMVPPPPPRPPLGSSPFGNSQWDALNALRGEVEALKLQLAGIARDVASQSAGVRQQTLQLLIGGVVTCVTAIVGSRVVAPKPEATTTVLAGPSAFDRELAACKPLPTAERETCVERVARSAAGLPPK